MKKIRVLLICGLLLFGCSSTKLNKYSEMIYDAGFDTPITLLAFSKNEDDFLNYKNRARELFLEYNKLFDRYNTYEGVSNIKTINDNAGIAPVKVDQEIIDVLNISKTYSELSDNQYDVTMGAVLEIWHSYRTLGIAANENDKDGTLPSMDELEKAKQCTGWDKVEINEADQSVYLNQSCASLDLGSVAKGYASEQVAQKLSSEGLDHAIINAGGNVRIIGERPSDAWTVGVQLPEPGKESSLVDVQVDADYSMVTSGDYQRAYSVDGKSYHHIIDPHTLLPATHMRAITVACKDSTLADILSTTLFTLSFDDGMEFLADLRKQGTEVDAIWVFDETTEMPENVELVESKGFQLYISDGLKDKVNLVTP